MVLPRFPVTLKWQKKLGLTHNGITYRLSKLINFYNKTLGYQKMPPKIREELSSYFKPHNKKLFKISWEGFISLGRVVRAAYLKGVDI